MTMKKEYLRPVVSDLLICNLERSICSAELAPLEESGDMEELGWN